MATTLPGTGEVISSDALDATTGLNGAAPDAAGEKVQRAKIGFGADSFFQDVNPANPLPVALAGVATEATLLNVAKDGADITTPTAMPAGGVGIRGWLSAIWTKLNGSLAVTGAFFQATQPVSGPLTDAQLRAVAVPISGTVTTGGLTDTQLRATAVAVSNASLPLPAGAATEATLLNVARDGTDGATPPAVLGAGTGIRGWLRSIYEKLTGSLAVTGTFFQATQPVSAASLPLPTGAATEATLAARIPANGQALMAASVPVVIASNQSAVAVSGTVTANAGTGPFPVSDNAGSLTVDAPVGTPAFVRLSDGTAAIATLPVSLAALPALVAGTASIGTVVLTAETTKVIGTVNPSALVAGTANIGRVMRAQPTGYVNRNFFLLVPTAAPATEALVSLTQYYNNAAVAATTTPAVVPTGKILRIMGMRMNTASLAAAGMVVVRLRAQSAGLVAVTSPVVAQMQCGSVAAVAALQSSQEITFGPEGIDIPAGFGVGFSFAGYVGATLTLQSFTTCEMWGYEYTA